LIIVDPSARQVPKGELSTYVPIPLGISSEGYGLQMDTYYRYIVDSVVYSHVDTIICRGKLKNLNTAWIV